MKKRILSLLLALVMTASMLPVFSVAAVDAYSASPTTSDYFYNQLNDRAKAIYNELLHKFSDPATKADYYDGTKPIDLIGVKYGSDTAKADDHIITTQDIEDYQKGNKDIFNDFCAAKDALDLDHSELWYIDSGYLTFRVTHGSVEAEYGEGYHVLIGPGRGETYLLGGLTADEVELNGETIKTMDEKINATINSMVNKAVSELNAANSAGTYSEPDKLAFLATNIHDQITKGIHYRYEIECNSPEDAKFIRTIYGMQTHEGVCEAYARTLQVCLTRLGIQCVLIHGVQTKGTPEDHMWNAVNIPNTDEQKTPRWYVIDATWDDPLTAKWDGTRDLTFKGGDDGKETNTYLLVGQSLVGEHWRPSGYVSTGNFEFKYPTIETAAFSGATVLGDDNGLKVDYSTGSSVDGAPAGVFSVTYQGMDAKTARDKGLYFMVKMYDYHPDGTADVMKEWYYADATFVLSEGNPYFGDYDGALRIYTPTCEYVEIAVTTREPDQRDTWENPASSSYLSLSNGEAGYFHGDESEIIAQSGMLYNVNSKYEAPPYVLTQFPAPNGNCTAGYDYRFKVTYDDDLYYRPSANSESGISAIADISDIPVRVRYTTIQQDLHDPDKDKYVRIAGELPFDVNRDGYVDMPGVDGTTNDYVDFKWIYSYEPAKCPNNPNHESNHTCDVTKGCPIKGVEFNFRASDQWIDDITEYNFAIDGVVGSRSSKAPNNFSVISCIPGLCPACYRSQGIDWNLWGQPTLLDAPENLDLESLASAEDNSEAAQKALDKFNEEIHRDEINGRLMLVVEDKSKGAGNREDYERINDALSKDQAYQNQVAGGGEVLSSVFEINFNRVCPMVKLKPNKGQSLRVQVGYPAGVTYETLADYDLKAYHFVRCSNDGESYYCQEVKDALASASDKDKADILKNHKWGEHIIKTEQITIVPTPYGMVIMCDAFSPFEIVAVKKSDTAAIAAAAETGSTLVVVSDGNGHVEVDGKEAVGTAGNVKFANEQDEKTFTVVPDKGYEVDSVILGGSSTPINVSPDGKFTVSGINHNEVLSVTFVPQTVTAAEQEFGYGDAVEVKACPHTTLKEDTSDPTPNADATCTTPGYKKAQVCAACGQTVVPATVIPATGHTLNVQSEVVTRVTSCTEGVHLDAVTCAKCNETIYEATDIPPLGHDYEDGVCTHCGAKEPSTTPSTPSGPSGSAGSAGSSGSFVGSTTETVTGADGNKTTTVTASDGSKTTTTTTADGVVGTTKTDADGNVTSVEVIMPYGSETGEAVVAPVKVKAFASAEDAPEIGITVREGSARVEIPVEDVNHGTVAVIVDEDGNETVIRDCAVDKNGVIINVDGSVTVKIVDRSVDFADVQTTGHWASDAVEFVAARNLFNGTGDGVFSPNTAMQRGMLVTVLHRLAYEPEADSTQITFGDIQSSDYFAEASAWANANHIVEGYNGSFRPRDGVSREDLVTILYRYAKFKGYATETDGNALTSFTDVQNIRSYAVDAMNWAVSVGLVNGVSADRLAPQSGAKRAEVATIIERFCENVVR